jgi:hypothetical protein
MFHKPFKWEAATNLIANVKERRERKMNKHYGHVTLALLFVAVLLLNMHLIGVNVSPVQAQLPEWPMTTPRNQTVVLSGYWPDPSWATSVPIIMDWGQCMETYIMYEPLFGTDAASGTIIKWLGESINWVNSTCIKVTLRSGIYWVKITDWDAWVAGTGGVSIYRPITAEDVKYSFYLYGAFKESGAGYTPGVEGDGRYWHLNSLRDRLENKSMNDFVIESDRVFYIRINPNYANSLVVWRRLTAGYLIVPKDVWQEIEEAYPGWLPNVGNIWTDPQFRAAHPNWLVASGMYLPMEHQTIVVPRYTLMRKNPLWWGKAVFGREPAPTYFTNWHFDTNEQIYAYMSAGHIDWDGNYVPKNVWQPAGYKTYLFNPPYFVDKSNKIMVPNHRRWPLCEPWLRWAIYMAIVDNFTDFNAVSEGYLKEASPLYIPADDAPARRLLNTTIESYYKQKAVTGDPIALLDQYCDFVDGAWYANLNQAAVNATWVSKYLSDDPYLQIGGKTRKASEWAADSDWSDDVDELSDVEGIQVKLGPYILYDIEGWSDINAISDIIDDVVTNELNITLTLHLISYSEYESKMNTMSTDEGVTFDFVHYCMHWGINGEMYERYAQFYNPPPGCYNNYGDLRNSTISNLLAQLDTAPYGSTQEKEIANQIQWLVGDELPNIPTAGHPDWYLYLETQWCRWPNEVHTFLAASPYGGSGQVANIQFILLSLGKEGWAEDVNNDGKIDGWDITIACAAYGSYPGHLRWDFAADINSDGKVDGWDITYMCIRYGQRRI